jgi:GT2 family glycosyltransferase
LELRPVRFLPAAVWADMFHFVLAGPQRIKEKRVCGGTPVRLQVEMGGCNIDSILDWTYPMALPSVAIVIPTRNRHESLKRCLSRLIPYAGAHPECSIVVSDDGDALQTREALAGELTGVQVIQGPRRGPAANRNCGAAHATEELLIFLDDDCIPDQDLIAVYRDAALKNPEIGVFEGRISAEGEASSFADSAPINETGGKLWSCNFAIRRELFLKIGGFDDRYPFAAMEDIDLHLRVKRLSQVLFLPDARVRHQPERRLGWRVVQHHTLSVLLFLHLHGPRATGKTSTYFLRMAARVLVFRGLRQIRARTLKNPEQLIFQVWGNVQLALIVLFWSFHAFLARRLYPPCCSGCDSIQSAIAAPDYPSIPIEEGTDAH